MAASAPYSRYFSGSMGKVISDPLQSEQGTRFFGKLNRKILVLRGEYSTTKREAQSRCCYP
jgi:hypothetical protein